MRQRDAVEAAFGLGDSAAPDTFFVALGRARSSGRDGGQAAAPPARRGCALARHRDVRRPRVRGPASGARAPRRRHHRAGRFRRAPDTRRPPDAEAHGARRGRGGSPARRKCAGPGPGRSGSAFSSDAAGNPLALEELPQALAADSSATLSPQAPLPLTERLEARVRLVRFESLPDRASAPLLVAALDQEARVSLTCSRLRRRLPVRRVDLGGLAPVVDARPRLGRRERDSLSASADSGLPIYQHASLADRQASHDRVGSGIRQTTRIGASGIAPPPSYGPDDAVVDELEEAAATGDAGAGRHRQQRSQRCERAAQLTQPHAPAGDAPRRRSASSSTSSGTTTSPLRTVQEARWLDLDASDPRAAWPFLLETLDEPLVGGPEKVSAFVDLAEELGDAGEAGSSPPGASPPWRCGAGGGTPETRPRVSEWSTSPSVSRRPSASRWDSPFSRSRIRSIGDASCSSGSRARKPSSSTTRWRCTCSEPQPRACGHTTSGSRSSQRLSTAFARRVVSGCSRRHSCRQAWAAVHVADARVATPAAAEGARLADETGQPRWAAAALLAQATMVAERGDPEAAEELTARAEARAAADGRESDALARAVRAWARRDRASSTHATRTSTSAGSTTLPTSRTIRSSAAGRLADFIDAAARGGGELAVARDVLGHHERMTAADRGASLLRSPDRRTRARFLPPTTRPRSCFRPRWKTAFELAAAIEGGCSRLRALAARQRRAAESRAPLRGRPRPSTRSASSVVSERARQELRASGETSRARSPSLGPADTAGAADRADGRRGADEPRDRRRSCTSPIGLIGSHLYRDLPEARHHLSAPLDGESLADAVHAHLVVAVPDRRQSS